MSESYAEQLKNANLMLVALKNNLARLEKRGINEEFITKFETSYQRALALDAEQETLKSRLKEKSEELNQFIKEMSESYREAKKLVKIEMPTAALREFGINDKQ